MQGLLRTEQPVSAGYESVLFTCFAGCQWIASGRERASQQCEAVPTRRLKSNEIEESGSTVYVVASPFCTHSNGAQVKSSRIEC